jgi:hypothetical protein
MLAHSPEEAAHNCVFRRCDPIFVFWYLILLWGFVVFGTGECLDALEGKGATPAKWILSSEFMVA